MRAALPLHDQSHLRAKFLFDTGGILVRLTAGGVRACTTDRAPESSDEPQSEDMVWYSYADAVAPGSNLAGHFGPFRQHNR